MSINTMMGKYVTATRDASGNVVGLGDGSAYIISNRISSKMTVLPKIARMTAITRFIDSLVSAGVWGRLDALYVMAAHNEQAARINWIGAGAQDLTNINGATFTTDRGFAGDGATSYLTTSLAGNAADNYKSDNAFVAIWSLTNSTSNTANEISGGGNMYINSRTVAGSLAVRGQNTSVAAVSSTVSDSLGMSAISRNSSTQFDLYRNENLLVTPSIASEALNSTEFYIGKNSTNYSNRQVALAAIGAGLSRDQYLALYAAAREYMVSVGAVS